jgi:hypothetical protein
MTLYSQQEVLPLDPELPDVSTMKDGCSPLPEVLPTAEFVPPLTHMTQAQPTAFAN